jgi:hypothetical protein
MRVRFGTVRRRVGARRDRVVLWIFFAPSKLGGSSTYAVTSGVSMQPLLYKNDLAIVRAQSTYHVGDVVLYNSAVLGKPVLHRIILIQNGQYYFKGDNNDFVDPGLCDPIGTRRQTLGPRARDRRRSEWLGQPLHAGLLAGFAAMFVVLAGGAPRRRRSGGDTTALRHLRRRADENGGAGMAKEGGGTTPERFATGERRSAARTAERTGRRVGPGS